MAHTEQLFKIKLGCEVKGDMKNQTAYPFFTINIEKAETDVVLEQQTFGALKLCSVQHVFCNYHLACIDLFS